jgi:acetyl-CoA carboxylase biotin carboxyl carrier protein
MRMHARKTALIAKPHGEGWQLCAPMPGVFRPNIHSGSMVDVDGVVGVLEVLGSSHELVVPANVTGYASKVDARAVQFGDVLVEVTPGAIAGTTRKAATAAQTATSGLVFRAPTSGRFYGRSSPDKPAFVNAGDELARGATVCLLEVMKTFHRVHFGGADMPERAKVKAVLVKDGDDVNAGDPLLALDT